MDQAVLVHADIDEGTEGRHVGNGTFEDHVRCQVRNFFHAFLEGGHFEFRPGVTSRLGKLRDDIFHRRQAHLFIGVSRRIQRAQEGSVTDHAADLAPLALRDCGNYRVGFRVDRRGIQGVGPVHYPQEARGLFKRFFAETGDLEQIAAAGKTAAFIAQGDDIAGDSLAQAGHPGQQRHRRCIDVYAHRVYAVFDHTVKLPGQLCLADIVLVLSHAY